MTKGKLTIFLSHVYEDETIALYLKTFFEEIFLNAEVFVSGMDLKGGEVWFEELRGRLAVSTAIIALVSKYSKESNWVHFESGAGFISNKTIPVVLDRQGIDALKPPWSLLQARSFDSNGIAKLLRDISTLADLREPTKFPGIDELMRSVHRFVELRETEQIPDGATAAHKAQTFDSILQERLTTLEERAKLSIRHGINSRRNVFDLPANDELGEMSITDLCALGNEVGLDLPFFFANRLVTAALTVPYETDAKWKKQAYQKHLDDVETLVRDIEHRYVRGAK